MLTRMNSVLHHCCLRLVHGINDVLKRALPCSDIQHPCLAAASCAQPALAG
jgi:hypothetical protein